MSKKRRNTPVAKGIITDCDVCGGFMFNAKRYMQMNDAYFDVSLRSEKDI